MPYVNSSAIDRVEWEDGTLSIWFRGSSRHDYSGVPEGLYKAFLAAPSKGEFFNTRILDRFRERH